MRPQLRVLHLVLGQKHGVSHFIRALAHDACDLVRRTFRQLKLLPSLSHLAEVHLTNLLCELRHPACTVADGLLFAKILSGARLFGRRTNLLHGVHLRDDRTVCCMESSLFYRSFAQCRQVPVSSD